MSNATRRRATDVLSFIKSTFPVLRRFHQAKMSLRHVAWRRELVRHGCTAWAMAAGDLALYNRRSAETHGLERAASVFRKVGRVRLAANGMAWGTPSGTGEAVRRSASWAGVAYLRDDRVAHDSAGRRHH